MFSLSFSLSICEREGETVRSHSKQPSVKSLAPSIIKCLDVRKEKQLPSWTDVIPETFSSSLVSGRPKQRGSMTYFHDRRRVNDARFLDRARTIWMKRKARRTVENVYGKGMKSQAL